MNYYDTDDLMNCPFCNCKPVVYGFEESKEIYNITTDRVTIHCVGCGVNMTQDKEEDDLDEVDVYKKLLKKWDIRHNSLGIDNSNFIDKYAKSKAELSNMIAKQREIVATITDYGDGAIYSHSIEERHKTIIDYIKQLKEDVRGYKFRNNLLISIIILLLFIIWMTKKSMLM